MGLHDMTIADALANIEHLKALGQTEISLYREVEEFPFDKVVRVDEGISWRLNGPSSVRLIAQVEGLTFTMSVDFEQRDANGKGVSMFDRDRLRDLMRKLPEPARQSFADMLTAKVLPPMRETTANYRKALNEQEDSTDCVLGLIALARGEG